MVSSWNQVHSFTGYVIFVKKSQPKVLHSFLHCSYECQTAVEVGIYLQKIVKTVFLIDQQVQKGACKLDSQHDVIKEGFS